MRKQNYVGQYFVGVAENEGNGCNGYEVGECVWQDSDNLLCVTYVPCSSGEQLLHCLVVPFRIAKHFTWFKTFVAFYEVVKNDNHGDLANDGIHKIKRVPNNAYNEVIYHEGVPKGNRYGSTDIALLARHLKEHPESGKLIIEAIIDAAEKARAQVEFVHSTAKAIQDAGLNHHNLTMLAEMVRPSLHQAPDGFEEVPF